MTAGKCRRCSLPRAAGLSVCEEHAAMQRQRSREARERRSALKQCFTCGGPARPGHVRCAECAQRRCVLQNQLRAQRAAEFLCVACGSPELTVLPKRGHSNGLRVSKYCTYCQGKIQEAAARRTIKRRTEGNG